MSGFDRVYQGLKAVMMMDERFDRIDIQLRDLADDLDALASSHAELAQRVARIEGFIDGAAAASTVRTRRLPKK